MTSGPDRQGNAFVPRCAVLLGLLLCLCWPGFACSQEPQFELPPPPQEPEAWLLTYGPGTHYWERFGHNAIWIRDPQRRLDHAFNFGFFDFAQEDFFVRFLQGRMLYFSAARLAEKEFFEYRAADRSIFAQKLDLDHVQLQELTAFLVTAIQPENRDYLYDYYLNNCSTKVRDAIDRAFGGQLRRETEHLASGMSFRDHTRRLTQDDFWVYLGLEIVLGAPVDRLINRWEEMFIPQVLADRMHDAQMVSDELQIYSSTKAPPPAQPQSVWTRYLAVSLGLLLLLGGLTRWTRVIGSTVLARTWLVTAGLMGSAMCFFWLGTDHAAASLNLNLLVFSPLWLIAAAWRGSWRFVSWLLVGLSALAFLMIFMPPSQYTLDVLAAFLPLNLAAAYLLWRASQRSAR